jgi:hypothetical protein
MSGEEEGRGWQPRHTDGIPATQEAQTRTLTLTKEHMQVLLFWYHLWPASSAAATLRAYAFFRR